MSEAQNTRIDLDNIDWDVIIVGTGMGGGTLGYALARAGRRVLFLEKGCSNLHAGDDCIRDRLPDDRVDFRKLPEADRLRLLAQGGRSIDEVLDQSGRRPTRFMPFIGSGTGGSSALYGMALERLFPVDFTPRDNYRDVGESTLPEAWPLTYSELRPWYEAAERLYRVRGTPDPLRASDSTAHLLSPPPLTPGNAQLFEHFQGRGLHPYQLHLACEHAPECETCQGYLCARKCKNDAGRICVAPAIAEHGARLLTECAVERLEADRTAVTRVLCRWRGEPLALRSKLVVLAAGALVTPVLLLNSKSSDWPRGLANESDLVGRNLMRHSIDLLLVMLKLKDKISGQTKELALNDFYCYEGEKFGTLQSFGPLPPISYFLNQPGLAGFVLACLRPLLVKLGDYFRARGLVLTSIMEDLPYADNRVLPGEPPCGGPRQRVRLTYRPHDLDLRRLAAFRAELAKVLKVYPVIKLRGADDNKAIAHVCGTCRFGADPKTSVLDPHNRAHGVDNLYVIDASFFPSSGGLNPSLTIAANALRVAEQLHDRL